MSILLHICPESDWQAARANGEYRADSLATEGFIHCSMPAQVIGTADLFFRGRTGLVLLVIDPARVAAAIKYEDAGDGVFFPHLYGPLGLDAVTDVVPFPPDADGTFSLPAVV